VIAGCVGGGRRPRKPRSGLIYQSSQGEATDLVDLAATGADQVDLEPVVDFIDTVYLLGVLGGRDADFRRLPSTTRLTVCPIA
jgi:hypothetical protein